MAAVTMTLGAGEIGMDESTTEDLIVEEIAKHGKQENVSVLHLQQHQNQQQYSYLAG